MAGRGRGRKKRVRAAANSVPAGPPGVSATGEVVSRVPANHAARSVMMTTPLGALMRIEATVWMNARGTGGMPLDNFYALARTHEWLGMNHHKAASKGERDETKPSPTMVAKYLWNLSHDVYELLTQMSDEERLLFDFLVVSSWDLNDTVNLYPLYRLHSSSRGKIHLEVVQKPTPKRGTAVTTAKNGKTATRSEILWMGYHHSQKHFSFVSTVGSTLHSWWEHAKNVAETILNHRSMTATAVKVKVGSCTEKPSTKSLVSNNSHSTVTASPTKNNGGVSAKPNGEIKMTLEERVRARSLLNPKMIESKQSSAMGGEVPQINENKCLLALADALRSYSQRRCLDSSGGGTALDRLRNRGVNGPRIHTTKNIARLPVMDLMKDARMTWSAVVNESVNQSDKSRERGNSRGVATPMVNIDLSSVLFHLRLKMVSDADVSDKRQMELHLLGLIDKLATLAPRWVHLRKAPAALTSTKSLEKKMSKLEGESGVSANKKSTTTISQGISIRHSIIVIRNDSVDYAMEVRAKLGGKVHNSVGLAVKSNRMRKTGLSGGSKRSFQEVEDQQQLQNDVQRTVGAADALVPPSFRRMYGKALCLERESKKN